MFVFHLLVESKFQMTTITLAAYLINELAESLIIGEATLSHCTKTGVSNWSHQARILCMLLDEAREEYDKAQSLKDDSLERAAFAEIMQIATLLDDVIRSCDGELDELLL
ncbi:MAG: hypothetical protein AAGB04_09165 [Pseudomonadota bacterium]